MTRPDVGACGGSLSPVGLLNALPWVTYLLAFAAHPLVVAHSPAHCPERGSTTELAFPPLMGGGRLLVQLSVPTMVFDAIS